MIRHSDLGTHPFARSRLLFGLLKEGKIVLGGNDRLKIYGRLDCSSGERMKWQNRVFFSSEKEAVDLGFRPCGHCMWEEYVRWKEKEAHGFTGNRVVQ